MTKASEGSHDRIVEVVLYFLRLGLLGFGGPVALVGQMGRELADERGWLTKEQMREAVAICQSLPGPLAIQVGIYISYLRAGFWGAWSGGWAFILPNFVIVAALGALYVYLGDLKPVTAIFYGVSPVVIALILHSCWRLAKLGMEDGLQWAIAAVCFVVTIALRAEVALLFIGAGLVGILYYGTPLAFFRRPTALAAAPFAATAQVAPVASGSTLVKLLLFFLKAGSLTFGSGLVIVPFLEQGLVREYGWLDQRQFLIAVARHDQPRPGRHHRDLCRLSRRRLLGVADFDRGHFSAVVHIGVDRCANSRQASRQHERSGLRKGGLRGCDRDHSWRVRAARPHRNRRLANGAHRSGVACRLVPLEGKQSHADGGGGRGRTDRLPDSQSNLGDGQIGRSQ
jgi:chromate transport protein ChrA